MKIITTIADFRKSCRDAFLTNVSDDKLLNKLKEIGKIDEGKIEDPYDKNEAKFINSLMENFEAEAKDSLRCYIKYLETSNLDLTKPSKDDLKKTLEENVEKQKSIYSNKKYNNILSDVYIGKKGASDMTKNEKDLYYEAYQKVHALQVEQVDLEAELALIDMQEGARDFMNIVRSDEYVNAEVVEQGALLKASKSKISQAGTMIKRVEKGKCQRLKDFIIGRSDRMARMISSGWSDGQIAKAKLKTVIEKLNEVNSLSRELKGDIKAINAIVHKSVTNYITVDKELQGRLRSLQAGLIEDNSVHAVEAKKLLESACNNGSGDVYICRGNTQPSKFLKAVGAAAIRKGHKNICFRYGKNKFGWGAGLSIETITEAARLKDDHGINTTFEMKSANDTYIKMHPEEGENLEAFLQRIDESLTPSKWSPSQRLKNKYLLTKKDNKRNALAHLILSNCTDLTDLSEPLNEVNAKEKLNEVNVKEKLQELYGENFIGKNIEREVKDVLKSAVKKAKEVRKSLMDTRTANLKTALKKATAKSSTKELVIKDATREKALKITLAESQELKAMISILKSELQDAGLSDEQIASYEKRVAALAELAAPELQNQLNPKAQAVEQQQEQQQAAEVKINVEAQEKKGKQTKFNQAKDAFKEEINSATAKLKKMVEDNITGPTLYIQYTKRKILKIEHTLKKIEINIEENTEKGIENGKNHAKKAKCELKLKKLKLQIVKLELEKAQAELKTAQAELKTAQAELAAERPKHSNVHAPEIQVLEKNVQFLKCKLELTQAHKDLKEAQVELKQDPRNIDAKEKVDKCHSKLNEAIENFEDNMGFEFKQGVLGNDPGKKNEEANKKAEQGQGQGQNNAAQGPARKPAPRAN